MDLTQLLNLVISLLGSAAPFVKIILGSVVSMLVEGVTVLLSLAHKLVG